jgi:hypothetical protein
VTPADDDEWAEEIDDDLDLRDNLHARRWDDVATEVIDRQASGLPLLTPEAFAAFLPAWHMRSLERLDRDNLVREFTVYEFCPVEVRPAHIGALLDEKQHAKRPLLNREQRKVVLDFLALVSEHERCQFLRASSESALSVQKQGFAALSSDWRS